MDTITLSGFTFPENTITGDKTFTINLEIPSGSAAVFKGGMTRKEITMTIVDDGLLRLTPSIARQYRYADEDVGNVVLEYTLSSAISSNLTFKVRLSDANLPALANATKGVDYQDVMGEFVRSHKVKLSG